MERTNYRRAIAILCISFLLIGGRSTWAGDWPGWRGPTAQGHTTEKDLPLTWDAKSGKNVLWKVDLLPGRKGAPMSSPGWSCPIVWRDRVFLTTALWEPGINDKESRDIIPEHHVLCFQASDGKQLWDTLIPPGKCVVNNHYHGYAVPTPVTDGKHVYVLFGSGVAVALDFHGKIVWREELPHKRDIDGGICGSLILHGDNLIMSGIANPALRSLDKKNGKLLWEQKTRAQNRMATPAFWRNGEELQLIHLANGVQGIDPATGEVLWSCKAPSGQSSPVFGEGLVYVDAGRGGRDGAAVKLGGKGDTSKTGIEWKVKVQAPAGSSGIVVGKYLYRACNNDTLRCWEMATGKLVYEERLLRVSPSTSPIASADGRIYFASSGRSYVIKAGPKLEILAKNELGEGNPFSTPAVANGRLFIKGRKYLWCIAAR